MICTPAAPASARRVSGSVGDGLFVVPVLSRPELPPHRLREKARGQSICGRPAPGRSLEPGGHAPDAVLPRRRTASWDLRLSPELRPERNGPQMSPCRRCGETGDRWSRRQAAPDGVAYATADGAYPYRAANTGCCLLVRENMDRASASTSTAPATASRAAHKRTNVRRVPEPYGRTRYRSVLFGPQEGQEPQGSRPTRTSDHVGRA